MMDDLESDIARIRIFPLRQQSNDGFHCCAVASVEGKSGFVAMTNGENGPEILKNLIMGNLMQEFLGG